ncbi:hypothetical protein GYA54_03820 [Candidatus Kuenenbacteria bacterium]|nr:hypothetical protein [Candidatus Kuenenbacteria bacterium]
MFDPKQITDPKTLTPQKSLPAETSFEVRTIPSKFLSIRPSLGSSGAKGGLKKNILLGLVIVLLVGGAMAVAAWLFLKSVKKENPLPAAPVVNQPSGPSNLGGEAPIPPTPTTTDPVLPEEELRDINTWQTYEDIAYNYSFRYPSIWTAAVAGQDSSAKYNKQVLLSGDNIDAGRAEINIYNYNEEDLENILGWLSSNFGLSEVDLEAYKLNNKDAYRYDDIAGNTYSIFSLYEGNIYQLHFYKSDKNIINEVYNQFIINWEFSAPPEDETGDEIDYEPAVDSDTDGLTNIEEALYGTNPENPDTDGDTYQDGNELSNLYNPLIAGSAKIYDSDLVKTYVNNDARYNLVYPSSWEAKESSGTVIFQSNTGEFVQISIEPNSDDYQDIKAWYKNYLELDSEGVTNIKVSGVESAILSTDRLKVYFMLGDNIYSIIYNINLRKDGNFMSTFNMVLKSFKIMRTE